MASDNVAIKYINKMTFIKSVSEVNLVLIRHTHGKLAVSSSSSCYFREESLFIKPFDKLPCIMSSQFVVAGAQNQMTIFN